MTTTELLRRVHPWRRQRKPGDVAFWTLPPIYLWRRF